MDLLNQTKKLCKIYNINPARSKGQNFLINENIYDKIIEAADLKSDDVVLEVGSGLGFLTAKLAERVKKVIAVELDDKLAGFLKNAIKTQGVKNVEVINEDILKFSIFNFSARGGSASGGQFSNNFQLSNFQYKIVANLPYNITSVFLRKFLSAEHKPKTMVLMLQKEVAERICADAGKMSLLAVSVQFYAEPRIIQYVPKNNFWPEPEVDSAIIQLEIKSPQPPFNKGGNIEKEFFRLVKIGFSAKRKMLKNNLANGLHITQTEAVEKLKKAGFSEKIRAQELSVEDWIKLAPHFLRDKEN